VLAPPPLLLFLSLSLPLEGSLLAWVASVMVGEADAVHTVLPSPLVLLMLLTLVLLGSSPLDRLRGLKVSALLGAVAMVPLKSLQLLLLL
jgi:hypothetical protein